MSNEELMVNYLNQIREYNSMSVILLMVIVIASLMSLTFLIGIFIVSMAKK